MIINDPISKNESEKIATILAGGSLNKDDVAMNSFNYIEVFLPEEKRDISYTEFEARNSYNFV